MTDRPNRDLEEQIAPRLRRDVDAGLPALAASDAARMARTQRRFPIRGGLLAASTILVAVVVTLGAMRVLTPGATTVGVAKATVNGVEYRISAAPGWVFPPVVELQPAGTVTSTNYGSRLRGQMAYAIPGIGTTAALVVPVNGALRTDFPGTQFLVLLEPRLSPTAALCPYMDAALQAASNCAGPPATISASPSSSPTPDNPLADLIEVAPGEQVQPGQAGEDVLHALDRAYQFAQAHPDDIGYPWIEPSSKELVLSAVTPQGRDLLESEAASLGVASRIRDVDHSIGQLQQIQEAVTHLNAEGVADAQLIFATYPDQRDNRIVISMSARSADLIEALARRFGADAIAILIDPTRGPAGTASSAFP